MYLLRSTKHIKHALCVRIVRTHCTYASYAVFTRLIPLDCGLSYVLVVGKLGGPPVVGCFPSINHLMRS